MGAWSFGFFCDVALKMLHQIVDPFTVSVSKSETDKQAVHALMTSYCSPV